MTSAVVNRMKITIVRWIRIIYIIHLFGLIAGLKYTHIKSIYDFEKAKGEDIPHKDSGKEIRLKYDHHSLTVRGGSTDLLLVESILVGRFINKRYVGEYSQVEEYLKELPHNPVIIDAGANIGLFSRLCLKKRPDANIYAIEPEGNNYKVLKSNINEYAVKTYRCGVWPKNCKLKVIPRDTGDWGFIVREADGNENSAIDAISLNSLINENNLNRIDLLKMDVEGSEYEIFSSDDLGWLELCRAIVIETHDHIVKGSDELVNKILLDKGFTKYVYDENQLFIRNKENEKHAGYEF